MCCCSTDNKMVVLPCEICVVKDAIEETEQVNTLCAVNFTLTVTFRTSPFKIIVQCLFIYLCVFYEYKARKCTLSWLLTGSQFP